MTKKKILVVDDDPVHLVCARDLLEAEGYQVVIHPRGLGASERVMTERPDLVLVDMNMPALSGEGLVSVLRSREHTRSVPILLYSSNDEVTLRQAADRLGIEGYVGKGDPEELRRTVARVLRFVGRERQASA